MSDMCNDNRFELVAKYKAKLIESTNIETSADEMAVIDNILFRMWQIGWLDRWEQPTVDAVPVVRCKDCLHRDPDDHGCDCAGHEMLMGGIIPMPDNFYCADGERRTYEQQTEGQARRT